jgi:DNA-binding LytR/AlgR family response regulator
MSTLKLLTLDFLYWFAAATVLLVDAWPVAKTHLDVAIVRYVYFILIGLLASGMLLLVYKSRWFSSAKTRLAWVIFLSASAALLTAVIVNPITYLMIGRNIHAIPFEILSTGTLYFALLFVIWSALYFQLHGESLLHPAPDRTREVPRSVVFQVEKMGELRQLQDRDLVCVRANGDYVDLVTAANTYIKKDTLANVEAILDSGQFKRVHRSAIVNVEKVERVTPRPGGCFEIALEGGNIVQSSRSYRSVVEAILPSG